MNSFRYPHKKSSEHPFCHHDGGAPPSAEHPAPKRSLAHCERKTITVVFTDLAGYTAMSEAMDPEDVKEIMEKVFGEINRIVAIYQGYIDKIIGDAALILFGVPASHEDDAVRAIRAALEIHQRVAAISDKRIRRMGRSLTMHTGINTGLVVIDEINSIHETQGFTGDAINLAARLEGLAGAGEIMVGPDTYTLAKDYFRFDPLPPTRVKGKAHPLTVYRVVSHRLLPFKPPRRIDLQAKLIGRRQELCQLRKAVTRLINGQGTVVSISGDAGTGKSRLVEEFKSTLNLEEIRWLAGCAFTYSQQMPYTVIQNLLIDWAGIKDGDPPHAMRHKIRSKLSTMGKVTGPVTASIERLFSLSEISFDSGPEIWKMRFESAFRMILKKLAKQGPTVVCLEDLHWADALSLALIRSVVSAFCDPMLLVCVQRTELALIDYRQRFALADSLVEIRLQPLSLDQSQRMLKSLLNAVDVPDALNGFVEKKVEGNPFYLEEVVRSLLESGILIRNCDSWQMNQSMNRIHVPMTIQGVISGRLDRLDFKHKQILREASVIGRAFLYDILTKITRLDRHLDACLDSLQNHDLIKQQPDGSELAYMFKHALTQEVVYRGLLKKERKAIHERIGLIMEKLYADRLPEFYEALAYHFRRGRSIQKAVDYLIKSGEKSLHRYALEQAHRFYRDAFELLQQTCPGTVSTDKRMLDVINGWAFVYYYRGRYRDLLRLLKNYKPVAESLNDPKRLGLFNAWMGCALWHRERFQEAHGYLQTALHLGRQCEDRLTIGYASCWLTWICTELGAMPEAVSHGKTAQAVFHRHVTDPYIYINSLAGMGYAYWHSGRAWITRAFGERLIHYADATGDNRSRVMGYCCLGWHQLAIGDLNQATWLFNEAVSHSTDPWYAVFPKLAACYGYISFGQMKTAERLIQEILEFSRIRGAEFVGHPAHFFKGVLLINQGRWRKGARILKRQLGQWEKIGNRLRLVSCGHIWATANARMAQHAMALTPFRWIQKTALLLKGMPLAGGKASQLFAVYIKIAREIGAKGVLGQAYLNWGMLYQAEGRSASADRCFRTSVQYFKQCRAEAYLRQAKEALASVQFP